MGQVIQPGQAFYKVGNQPVTLMNGSTPAYRDLSPSDSAGPDILELNRNLRALGFNAAAIVGDDEWQAATTEGVDLFQESLGETETGTPDAGAGRVPPGRPDRSLRSTRRSGRMAARAPGPATPRRSMTPRRAARGPSSSA